MSKGIATIAATNDLNAIVRQINQNFQILSNRTVSGSGTSNSGANVILPGSVTDNTQFAVYYDAAGLPRVVIGSTTATGEELIAISSEGVNVLNAIKKNPMVAADFFFNSSLTNASLASLAGRISTVEGDLSNLVGRVSDLEQEMADVELELANHELRIEALEGGGGSS